MAHDQMRLDHLLERDVNVQWFEGVALIQAVCRQLCSLNTSDTRFPDASQIALSADGTVTITGAAATKSVPAAGHMLARLLSPDAPVRLRLLVSTGEHAAGGGLQEFLESVAYFERPNPQGILTALYERAIVSAPARTPQIAGGVPSVEESTVTAAVKPVPKKRPTRRTAVAAGVLLALTAGLLFRAGSPGGDIAAVAASLASVVAPAPEEQLVETGDSGTGSREGVSAAARESHARTDSPRAGLVRASRVDESEELPSITTTPTADALDADWAAAENATEILRHDNGNATVPPAAETIYSQNDPSVIPPRQVYPAMPAKPSPGIRAEDLTVVDLIVSAEGLVEHVRMRTAPRNVHEFMLVSAAKAWRFEPATLEGQPVRFRHSVAITRN